MCLLQLLFDRTAASQEAVLHTLTEEMTRQRIRELFVCYCVLLLAGRALSGGRWARKGRFSALQPVSDPHADSGDACVDRCAHAAAIVSLRKQG